MSDFRAFLGQKGLFSAKMFFMRRLASIYHACYPFALFGVFLLLLFIISGHFFLGKMSAFPAFLENK